MRVVGSQFTSHAAGLLIIHVQLLDNSSSVLNYLWVTVWQVLSEWLDSFTNIHVLKDFAAFFVHTQVTNREQCNTAR